MPDLNLSNADLEEVFGIKLVGKGQEVPKDAAKDFRSLTEELKQTAQAASKLSEETQKLDTSLKKTVGTTESEGFAGLATNALKAERAINALVSGHGLARAAPMLESLLSTIGGPAGLGAAFVAMEIGARVLGPTLEKFAGAISGEQVENLKKFTEYLKRMREEGEKLAANPLENATNAAARKFLEQGAGNELRRTMLDQLRRRGEGLSAQEKQQVEWWQAHRDQPEPQGKAGEWWRAQKAQAEAAEKKGFEAASNRSLELIARLGEGGMEAQAEVERILGERGRAVMQKMREKMEVSRLKLEAEQAKADFVGPPAPPPKTPEQRLHEELMEMARAEDAANQKARGQAATPQFLKDVVGRAAGNVGAGMDKNAAMQQAIADAQDSQRDRAEAEAKKRERDAVRAEMERRGFHGSPEQWDRVMHNAVKDLPLTAGNIVRAVQMGYMEAIRQMQQEAHRMNRNLGNSFQQQGGPW